VLFLIAGEVKLVEIETVKGILNNELSFETASDLQTAFWHKRLSRLVGVIQNSQCDSPVLLSFTHHFLPTVSSGCTEASIIATHFFSECMVKDEG